MSDTFDAVKELWENASPEDREKYLFKALGCFRKEVMDELKKQCGVCSSRIIECDNRYITKRQAVWSAFIILALALGLGLGTGYITFKEFVSHAISKI